MTIGDRIGTEEAGYEGVEQRATIASGIPALSERERLVLHYRFVDDMTQSQIAEKIGHSQMHVSRILRGALDRLRERSPSEGRRGSRLALGDPEHQVLATGRVLDADVVGQLLERCAERRHLQRAQKTLGGPLAKGPDLDGDRPSSSVTGHLDPAVDEPVGRAARDRIAQEDRVGELVDGEVHPRGHRGEDAGDDERGQVEVAHRDHGVVAGLGDPRGRGAPAAVAIPAYRERNSQLRAAARGSRAARTRSREGGDQRQPEPQALGVTAGTRPEGGSPCRSRGR